MMPKTDGERRAVARAMKLLEYRDRTRSELRDKLRQKGFAEEEVEAAINYVDSYGYLDDERFAMNYIYFNKDTRSRNKLRMDLRSKGVSPDIVESALEQSMELYETNELEVLKGTILNRVSAGTELTDKELNRLYGYLGRRGFSYGDIRKAMSDLEIRRTEDRGRNEEW